MDVAPDQIDCRSVDGTRRKKSFDGFRMDAVRYLFETGPGQAAGEFDLVLEPRP